MAQGPWKKPDDVGLRAGQYPLLDRSWCNDVRSLDCLTLKDICPSEEVDRRFFHPNTVSFISGIHRKTLDRVIERALDADSSMERRIGSLPFGYALRLTNEDGETVQKLVLASSATLSSAKATHDSWRLAGQQARARALRADVSGGAF